MREFKDDFQAWKEEPKQKECFKHHKCSTKCGYYKECRQEDRQRAMKFDSLYNDIR